MESANTPPEGVDYWTGEDEQFSSVSWLYAVANGDTRAGYWEWVKLQKDTGYALMPVLKMT